MKKNQVAAILPEQAKRRNKIFFLSFMAILIATLAFISFSFYKKDDNSYYIKYDENSSIDYEVYLKENEIFEDEFLKEDYQYIAALINYINADFNYELSFEENTEYKYSYKIETNVNVKSKETNNPIYDKSTIITEKENLSGKNKLKISEDVNIEYNKYNDFIKKILKTYNLNDVKSVLTVNMYITIYDICGESTKESVISLSVPLSMQTVAVELSDNLINTNGNVIKCESDSNAEIVFIITGLLLILIALIIVIYIIRYIIKTRTAETIYEREIKKILNNYGPYIQTLNTEFDFSDYQLLKLNTFNDMLEIRDTIRQPILMKENGDRTGTYFVIPSDKILYVYRMNINDIKKDLDKKMIEKDEI